MQRASRGGGRVRINTNRHSPEEFAPCTLLVRRTKTSQRLWGATQAAAGYCPETGEPKRTKWRNIVPGAWFTSARRPLFQQQPPRIKLFPLNGWTCDQRRQSTSHSLAPKRCHSSGEVRMIKPMFAVCYLNTLTQNRNQKREYHILIINGICFDNFDTASLSSTMHRSQLLLLMWLFICFLSCCHFDGTSCWMIWLNTGPARSHSSSTRQVYTWHVSSSQRGTGNEGTAATFPASRNGGARSLWGNTNRGKWQLSCLWKSCNFYISPSY